ncbi:MAG: hypothetical protein O6924_00470 [Alphaproteobacteria bacterium]|nr:hypothetical protein [Alphaproteobacteria bacterium]
MPRDEDTVNLDGNFLDRIPQDIRETFTDRQIAAVNQAFKRTRHGIDIRVSLPLPGGRRYLVLLMGKERRSRERRRFERLRQPLLTAMNVVTMATFGVLVFFFAVGFVQIMFR